MPSPGVRVTKLQPSDVVLELGEDEDAVGVLSQGQSVATFGVGQSAGQDEQAHDLPSVRQRVAQRIARARQGASHAQIKAANNELSAANDELSTKNKALEDRVKQLEAQLSARG